MFLYVFYLQMNVFNMYRSGCPRNMAKSTSWGQLSLCLLNSGDESCHADATSDAPTPTILATLITK